MVLKIPQRISICNVPTRRFKYNRLIRSYRLIGQILYCNMGGASLHKYSINCYELKLYLVFNTMNDLLLVNCLHHFKL